MRKNAILSALKQNFSDKFLTVFLGAFVIAIFIAIIEPSFDFWSTFVALFILIMAVYLFFSVKVWRLLEKTEKITTIEQAEAVEDRINLLKEERLLLSSEMARCEHKEAVFNDEIDKLRKTKEGFEDLKLSVTELEEQIRIQEQFKKPYSYKAKLFKIEIKEIDKELAAIEEIEATI
jgi:Ca2+/Na+ antiporter